MPSFCKNWTAKTSLFSQNFNNYPKFSLSSQRFDLANIGNGIFVPIRAQKPVSFEFVYQSCRQQRLWQPAVGNRTVYNQLLKTGCQLTQVKGGYFPRCSESVSGNGFPRGWAWSKLPWNEATVEYRQQLLCQTAQKGQQIAGNLLVTVSCAVWLVKLSSEHVIMTVNRSKAAFINQTLYFIVQWAVGRHNVNAPSFGQRHYCGRLCSVHR